MTDSFYELLVTRQKSGKDRLIFILSIGIVFLPILFFIILGPFTVLVVVALGALSYFFVWSKRNVEYEYSLLNHDLEIDIIYNQAKRKKLTSLDLTQAELIAPLTSHRMDSYRRISATDYSSGQKNDDVFAIVISQNQQVQCILVELDESMKNHFASFLPRTFFKD
ncbi:MAG: DUF6106 family protein [Hespellia sp.]|nr:DUF6106 family protein [Hespellia sp.]